ncbi:uncharacterized protein LOC129949627 [Eupeodes corollae]|uniref:uncharacterized protein LOC129949627 n=1 Tax=Eupeodes corollae TaxID=290404 RepID=UPI002490A5FB|nr:uncharacterized protein LOC129949627 [Eupeodes corollae]
MDSGSVMSEPISTHHRSYGKQKSASMTILSQKNYNNYSKHAAQEKDSLEAKMSNLEISLSSSNQLNGRRRKGSSLGGALSSRSARTEAKELRSALQDREAVIQNLRIQLCLGKLPRPSGPPLEDSEKPAAEQKLLRLKADAENKRIAIRNLKTALDKLDITDNIDIRIRQAELEYALGREELQLLSIVEEARALQTRLDKSKPELNSLYSLVTSGINLCLHAVQATVGRWDAQVKPEAPGLYVDWALEGEGLYKGDRLLEVNGKLVTCKTKEELQKLIGISGECQLVVLRKKATTIPQKQIDQQKEDNLRLQHRISYLEEQVKELQHTKEHPTNGTTSGHVTSISISSSSQPSTPPEKPLVYQRGNYITTLVGGKPIEIVGTPQNGSTHVTKTMIKDVKHDRERSSVGYLPSKSLSASKISISSDSHSYSMQKKEKERKDRYAGDRSLQRPSRLSEQHRSNLHARSVEHLNHYTGHERRREMHKSESSRKHSTDSRSVKSLDFDGENETKKSHKSDSLSDNRARPTPPKKPLRLSLQRAQSLQTVELHPNSDADRKRSLKRAHFTEKSQEAILIENCSPLHTSSLGRQKHNI